MALPVPRNVFWVRAKIIIKQEGKRQFDELMFCLTPDFFKSVTFLRTCKDFTETFSHFKKHREFTSHIDNLLVRIRIF